MTQTMLLRLWSVSGLKGKVQRFICTTASSQQLAEVTLQDAKPVTDIPGPRNFPLLGSIPSMMMNKDFDSKRMQIFWMSLMKQYGPIVKLVNPGIPPMIMVANPDDCEMLNRVTQNQPARTPLASLKHLRDNWTDDYFEKRAGIIVENGDEWWRVRSLVQTTLLKPMVINEYLTEMDDVSCTFMDRIQELQDKYGEMPDNFQDELYKWALESVGVVALDRRFGCLGAPEGSLEAQEGEELINLVNTLFSSLYVTEMRTQLWRLFQTPSYRRLKMNHEKLLKVVERKVDESVEYLQQRRDDDHTGRKCSVIQMLLSKTGLSKKDVITFIMDIIFAGIDTTSHTMAFCLYLLARNPEAQKKLQEEVDQVTAGLQGPLTIKHMARLSYTKAVIKETFRIFPLTIGMVRVLNKDMVLQGYRIPAGYNVLVLNSLMGWDESFYPRANEFLPERWNRARPLGDIHPYASLPFGAGPRMCVGRRVAEQEMYTLLARMAQRFTVEYNYEDIEQVSGLVFYPSRPLRFSFVPR
ncbi:probable cytochrome P450 49a1 isoform X2 [Portunus trituberculatus]|nr:probable cytochrome P450 49a1 isoform X2 [Portunus trituberculatus]XP_045111183.1 probable cytochrome P450 49a1 isoform X2 [Portunus trituberculatus]